MVSFIPNILEFSPSKEICILPDDDNIIKSIIQDINPDSDVFKELDSDIVISIIYFCNLHLLLMI